MASKMKLQPLELLDLGKCQTVSQIVDGMSRCAFGARMLGEVAAKLTTWCAEEPKPVLIYDGLPSSPLGNLLGKQLVREEELFSEVMTPEEYERIPARARQGRAKTALVVGGYSERHAAALYAREPGTTIYINPYDLCAPGQVKDGFFPDAVFADPNFILPILALVLDERLKGASHTVADLMDSLAVMPGVGVQVRQGAETVRLMMQKKGIIRFLTLSGAMTIAQMSLVLCEMIDREMVHSVTSTGALMAHGLVPGLGLKHYKYNPSDDDEKLARLGLNRVTDVLEPETNFDHIDEIMSAVLATFSGRETISPSVLHAALGKYLEAHYPEHRAILLSAYRKKVPVFVPAFTDSELGNDVYCTNEVRELEGKKRIVMDMEKDTAKLLELMTGAASAGIWTFGGGV
ncbi:MAG TPA: deoxyhypusine synthase family protein, partial [Tepidisphaeraceae bacterium]|nr:deoxyhypusine synthase family protein [Tepidisphaeraceae bacterium]